MSKIRYLTRPLVAVALVATAVSLAASTATAQQAVPVLYTFTNTADATSDAEKDWEVRVSIQSFGGCGESDGYGSATSGWIDAGDPYAKLLHPNCSYTFTAVARNLSTQEGKVCNAQLAWGSATPDQDELRTRGSTETTVSVKYETPLDCDSAIVATFSLDPEKVVEELPASGADPGLESRAQRAVEVSDFEVTVRPEASTKSGRGCDQTFDFDVSGGDDGEVEQSMPGIPDTQSCKFRATITEAPAPFKIVDTDGLVFNTSAATNGALSVPLDSLVELAYARIAIIQDVTDSGNQGVASYKIERSCAGVAALPPSIVAGGGSGIYTTPGGKVVATLTEGRFTVHSDRFANFGPGATYLAAARSTTSSTIAGCTVSVTASEIPESCTVVPAATQTLTWSSSASFEHFDFEFDIYCGDSTPPPITPSLPPPASDSSGTSTGDTATTTSTAPEAATDTVRLVARLLENGKIEFGLQQWQHDSTWSDRIFPRARLFPADTAVGRWLVSSAITLSVSESASDFADDTHVRIIARKQADGRVEFGLQQSDDGGTTWGERLLPTRRYFPASATALRWLGSSNITIDS